MDFGSILEKWEKQTSSPDRKNGIIPHSGYSGETSAGTRDFPARGDERYGKRDAPGSRRYRLLRKRPDASIDIHGFSRDEAWLALENFFEENSGNGSEKLLIIHGKGNHGSESVLKEMVRNFIERNALAGESGYNPAREGGTGATWVILKKNGA